MLTVIEKCKLVATENACGWPSLLHTLPTLTVTDSTFVEYRVIAELLGMVIDGL